MTGPSITIVIASTTDTRAVDIARTALAATPSHATVDVVLVYTGAAGSERNLGIDRDGSPTLRVIHATGATPGSARNRGIAAAKGERVWMLHDRAGIDAAALDRHLNATGVLIGPCAVPPGDPDAFDAEWWYDHRDLRLAEQAGVRHARDCTFANASAPTALWRDVAFDEQLQTSGLDDVELGQRLIDRGEAIAFDPHAGVPVEADDANPMTPRRMAAARGIDLVHFLAAHRGHHDAVLRAQPGLLERGLRRMVSRRQNAGGLVARAAANVTTAFAVVAPAGERRRRLHELADTCWQYASLARAARGVDRPAVVAALRASLSEADAPQSRMRTWMREHVADPLRAQTLRWRVHHVHGPRTIDRSPTELLVVTTVRNGMFYAPSFLEHHRRLGVRHFLVLDNGSDDGTLEFFRAQDDVSLFCTAVPYRVYENLMKRHMVRKHSRGKWNLFVDIDELFDYPCSDRMGLEGLLSYLEHRGATAVVTQMLDLFSSEPMADTPAQVDDLPGPFGWLDVSDISKLPYEFDPDPASTLQLHRGGIRRTVFGSENGLTKAALTFVDDDIELFVWWHHARRATFADVSCVLLHFPFNRAFYDKAEEAARTGRYGPSADHEYRAYWAQLAIEPKLSLWRPTAQRFVDVGQLAGLGFVQVPEAYRRWADDHAFTAK